MQFRLLYQGNLRGDGTAAHKQEIRSKFHPQLKTLWDQIPLCNARKSLNLDEEPNQLTLVKTVGASKFIPLVCQDLELLAELEITLLRPDDPGRVIRSGDIDNRLKTLFDALRMPKVESEIPNGEPLEQPMYCLLEDDSWVTNLTVSTDRLLQPVNRDIEVVLIIKVTLEFAHGHFTNRIWRPRLGPGAE
jgi:hypothetical protein